MKLTILSYGGGQNSTTLLYKYVLDKEFRKKYAPDHFIVIMSDTGDEHPHTYKHVKFIQKLCAENAVSFVLLTNNYGYHPQSWQTLRFYYKTKSTIGSKCHNKICTDKLKLQPIYSYMEDWIEKEYGFKTKKKKGFIEFAQHYGKIRMLIGITKDEEKRINKSVRPKWHEKSIKMVYPLIAMGMDRMDCQNYMSSTGLPVPYPSNCMLCPFISEIELLWLYRFHRDDYEEWETLERNKIKRCALKNDLTKTLTLKGKIVSNMGVWGKRLLPQVLEETIKTHGHLSDEELNKYKFSHNCVQSRY